MQYCGVILGCIFLCSFYHSRHIVNRVVGTNTDIQFSSERTYNINSLRIMSTLSDIKFISEVWGISKVYRYKLSMKVEEFIFHKKLSIIGSYII